MPTKSYTFAIDDELGIEDNLLVFAQQLGDFDAPLAAALTPLLADLAAGKPFDTNMILDELFAATDPGVPAGTTAAGNPSGEQA